MQVALQLVVGEEGEVWVLPALVLVLVLEEERQEQQALTWREGLSSSPPSRVRVSLSRCWSGSWRSRSCGSIEGQDRRMRILFASGRQGKRKGSGRGGSSQCMRMGVFWAGGARLG